MRAIEKHQVVILCGQTGSCKTTQLPKIPLEHGRGVQGLIGYTQPRRIAARATAARITQELKTELGGVVGYKIRFSDKISLRSDNKRVTDVASSLIADAEQFLWQRLKPTEPDWTLHGRPW